MHAFLRLGRTAQALVIATIIASEAYAQSTTGTIQGSIRDEQGAVIPGATVTIRNIDTNFARSVVSGSDGAFRFPNLPLGNYTLVADLAGFGRFTQEGIRLLLNQDAVAEVTLRPAAVAETVTGAAPTRRCSTRPTPRSGVRFDSRRISELPLGNSRDVFSLALSAAGVSQLGSGQTGFSNGVNFAVNGARLRSNNIMLDGQDSNDPSVTGRQQPINNTDIVQEVRLITNQFSAEYGRAAGSVMNVITKSGTNQFRGSAFWFHNDNSLNARTNLDKNAGRTKAPSFNENQIGFTLGGPVLRGPHVLLRVVPELAAEVPRIGVHAQRRAHRGRAGRCSQSAVGSRPQIAALLKFLPAAQSADRQERDLHRQRPDLRRAAGLAHRVVVGRSSTTTSLGADRSAVRRREQPARWPLHVRRPAQLGHGAGDARRADDRSARRRTHAFTGWFTRVFTQQPDQRGPLRLSVPRHDDQRRRRLVGGDSVDRDQRAGAARGSMPPTAARPSVWR